MIDPAFRDALLTQEGRTSVEAQLTLLDDLVKADRRYVRRLTIWSVAGWAVLVVIMAVGLGVPLVQMAVFCLPVAGVVMLIIMLTARRTATVSQIQASLASIDTQLKLILSQRPPSSGP